MKKYPFIIMTLLWSSFAFSNAKVVGNGGDAIVCRDPSGKIISAEIADYYEARTVRGMQIDLGKAESWESKLDLALKRLSRLDPYRASELKKQSLSFTSESRFISGNNLPDIPDTGGIVIPENCNIEQVAIQKEPQFPQDKRYLINQDIWQSFSDESKAGLVLHEILYREAISKYAAINSITVRYLNSLISSPAFDELDRTQYINTLVSAEFFEYKNAVKFQNRDAIIHLNLGRCTNSDYLTRYCSSFIKESDNFIVINTNLSVPPQVTYLNGDKVSWNELRTGNNETLRMRGSRINQVFIAKDLNSIVTYSFMIENYQNTILSSTYGELFTDLAQHSFDVNGMILDTIPFFTIPELMILTNGGPYRHHITTPYDYRKTIEIGLWSNSQLRAEFRPKTKGEIIQNGHWLRFSNSAFIRWKINEILYKAKLKSNCSNSANEVLIDFDSVGLRWLDRNNCYEIE